MDTNLRIDILEAELRQLQRRTIDLSSRIGFLENLVAELAVRDVQLNKLIGEAGQAAEAARFDRLKSIIETQRSKLQEINAPSIVQIERESGHIPIMMATEQLALTDPLQWLDKYRDTAEKHENKLLWAATVSWDNCQIEDALSIVLGHASARRDDDTN